MSFVLLYIRSGDTETERAVKRLARDCRMGERALLQTVDGKICWRVTVGVQTVHLTRFFSAVPTGNNTVGVADMAFYLGVSEQGDLPDKALLFMLLSQGVIRTRHD